jgi:ATP:corrinoid adenosyltransferase
MMKEKLRFESNRVIQVNSVLNAIQQRKSPATVIITGVAFNTGR